MKTRIITLLLFLLTTSLFTLAQKDVTTFLGIPVDGHKSEMRTKLIKKGFTPKTENGDEFFEGEFNGTDVSVYIVTNNNKVYRIMLMDKHSQNETNIKNRFNRLVSQFEANPRYHEPGMDFRIPEKENISYEMIVNKKIYEAAFYQKSDSSTIRNQVLQELKNEYTEEQLNNPDESLEQLILIKTFSHELDSFSKKSVWFRINERFGKYYIVMYYDNEYNHANGEDL